MLIIYFLSKSISLEEANPLSEILSYHPISESSYVLDFQLPPFTDFSFQPTIEELKDPSELNMTDIRGPVTATLRFNVPNEIYFNEVSFQCPGSGSESATCSFNLKNTVTNVEINAKNVVLNDNSDYKKFYFIESQELLLTINFENKDMDEVIFFSPVIHFKKEKFYKFSQISTTSVGNAQRYEVTVTKDLGPIVIHTIHLADYFQMSSLHSNGRDDNYDGIMRVPIIANGTRIVGFDIFKDDFMHCWVSKKYDKTFSAGKDKAMEIRLTAREAFQISILVLDYVSNSWYDSLEKWHFTFPEVYCVQPYGTGSWIPFWNSLNSTETEFFLGRFQWGLYPTKLDPEVPYFVYIEPTMIHLNPKYHKYNDDYETYIKSLQESSTNDEIGQDKLKALSVLDDAMRNATNFIAQGSTPKVMFTGTAEKFLTDSQLLGSLQHSISLGLTISGIGWDSTSNNQMDYVQENHQSLPVSLVPYYLIDANGKEYMYQWAGLFHSFKEYFVNDTKGHMANAYWIPSQLVKYMATNGWENLIEYKGYVEVGMWYQMRYWIDRFNKGSRPTCHLSTSKIEYSIACAEEVFSVHLAYGATPSYFSPDGTEGLNFWSNPSFYNGLRPFYQRWGPVFKKVLNHTLFYANQKGIVSNSRPQDEQNPALKSSTNENSDDQTTISMFCENTTSSTNQECYVNVFIAYTKPHNVGNAFKRTTYVHIDNPNPPTCLFMSKSMKCEVINQTTTKIVMEGSDFSKDYSTFRTVVLQVNVGDLVPTDIISLNKASDQEMNGGNEQNQNTPKPKNAELIAGVTVGVVVVVAIIIVVVVVVIKRRQEQSEDQMKI